MAPLSVVVLTCNEERNIGRCLASVREVADEIVVVDSFSTDATESICMNSGAVVYKRPWDGFSSAKNFGAEKARHDLVLSLDADEELSPLLARSIAEVKGSPPPAARFVRLSNYCGRLIRHGGWYPDIKTRMYDRTKARWKGAVHEELEGIGRNDAVLLKGECRHYSYYTVSEHLARTRHYASLSAQELFSRGKRPSLSRMVCNPAVKFIRDYLFRLGFLDGKNGLVIACVSSYGTFLKYAALRRLGMRQ